MENTIFGGGQTPSPAYDFRIYDQVWQRVVPGVDPYAAESIAPRMPQTEPAQVPAAIGQAAIGQAAAGQAAREDMARMEKYLQKLRREKEES